MNLSTVDIPGRLDAVPHPDPAWFLRSSGEEASGTIHGVAHARRVAVHALDLADALGASRVERDAVLLAALWHDIGREHDGGDYFHGARSAGKVLGLGLHRGVPPRVLELALFACTYHVPEDGWAERAARYESDPRAALRVLRILKDADALDRVRLGERSLKTDFLRLPESLGLVELAWALLRATEEKES